MSVPHAWLFMMDVHLFLPKPLHYFPAFPLPSEGGSGHHPPKSGFPAARVPGDSPDLRLHCWSLALCSRDSFPPRRGPQTIPPPTHPFWAALHPHLQTPHVWVVQSLFLTAAVCHPSHRSFEGLCCSVQNVSLFWLGPGPTDPFSSHPV